MEKNIYTNTGQTLKISGIIVGILTFLINAFDFSPGKPNEMILAVLGGLLGGAVVFLVLFYLGRYLYNLGINKTNLPLKHIKDWPQLLKITGIISLIIIILDVIFFFIVFGPCFIQCDGLGEGLVLLFIILPVLGFAVLLWIVPFIYYFLKQK